MSKVDWKDALELEKEVFMLIREQENYGVKFDLGRAHYFITLLETLKDEQVDIIRPFLRLVVHNDEKLDKTTGQYSYVSKIKLKNGEYTKTVNSYYPEDPFIVEGPFSRIQIEEPTLSKRSEVINCLLSAGWKPTIFTETGTPKLTDSGLPVESLEKVGDFGKALSLWYVYSHRQSQIRGLISHVRPDGRISASMDTCATNTFRCAHKIVANIPRPTSVFGAEMRSLFCVAEGRSFVGADASGLELRMLAHHMKDEDYIYQILSGDIHKYNQTKAGLPTRDNAKTFIYGFLYGAGDAKVGSIINKGAAAGKAIKETFFKEIPALSKLVNKVKRFAEARGYVPSIDNRKILIRSFNNRLLIHTALNCLLQANGSIVVKRAMIIANKEIKKRGLDAHQIIFYHDELAFDCASECADEVGQILVESMRLSGEYYKLNIPIDGEYKVGKDWSIH